MLFCLKLKPKVQFVSMLLGGVGLFYFWKFYKWKKYIKLPKWACDYFLLKRDVRALCLVAVAVHPLSALLRDNFRRSVKAASAPGLDLDRKRRRRAACLLGSCGREEWEREQGCGLQARQRVKTWGQRVVFARFPFKTDKCTYRIRSCISNGQGYLLPLENSRRRRRREAPLCEPYFIVSVFFQYYLGDFSFSITFFILPYTNILIEDEWHKWEKCRFILAVAHPRLWPRWRKRLSSV